MISNSSVPVVGAYGSTLRGGGGSERKQEHHADAELLGALKSLLSSHPPKRNAQTSRRDDKKSRAVGSDSSLLASLKKLVSRSSQAPQKLLPGLRNIILHAEAANRKADKHGSRNIEKPNSHRKAESSQSAPSQSFYGGNAAKIKPVD